MQEIIDKLKSMILLNTTTNMNKEQESYAAGIADALQVIEEYVDNDFVIGKHYFVIMYKDNNRNYPYIEEMKLYRINRKQKQSYCFTRNLNDNYPTPDLVLYSKGGLAMRVFETRDEAESRKYLYNERH